MVLWKRDLDLYTIGRPLERNANFWLNYMKGLKAESRAHRGTSPRLSSEGYHVDPQFRSEVNTTDIRSGEVKQTLVNVVETRPVYQLKKAPTIPQYAL